MLAGSLWDPRGNAIDPSQGELPAGNLDRASRARLKEKMELIARAREVLPFLERDGIRSVRPLLNALSEGVFVITAGGKLAHANRAAQRILGWDESEVIPLAEVFSAEPLAGILESALIGDVVSTDRMVLRGRNGSELHTLLTAIPVFDGERVRDIILVFRDITPGVLVNMSMAERERLHSRNQMETTLALNHQVNALLTQLLQERGAGNTLETALRGAVELCGADCGVIGLYDPERYTVRYRHSLGFPTDLGRLELPLEKTPVGRMFVDRRPMMVSDYPAYELHISAIAAAGARVFLGAPLIGEDDLLGVISLFRMTPDPFSDEERGILLTLVPVLSAAILKARYEHQLSVLATRDSLTGLWNRRVAFETLSQEIARTNRYGDSFTALLMDLDHFKSYNDRYGHLAGDQVLRDLATLMRSSFRSTDKAARTGGEEFMVLLPRTELAGGAESAEHFRAALEQLDVNFQGLTLRCTTSIGCAEYREGETEEDFFARLDALLYLAKSNGRNRVESA